MADFPIIPGEAFTSDQIALLDEPLNAQLLKERDGAGGKKLKYLDGRTAIETANRIFGKGKWGFRIVARTHEKIEARDNKPGQEYFTADIELYVAGNPFPFPGDGIGGVKSNTVEGIEMARKDAVTDALKRALCYYGDQFGLSLRDKDGEPLVEIAEGVMVKVNEVQVNKNGANTVKPSAAARVNAAANRPQIAAPANNAKVVDSQPPTPMPEPAKTGRAVDPNAPQISPAVRSLKSQAITLGIVHNLDEWKAYKESVLGKRVADSDLQEQQIATLRAAMDHDKQQPAMAS